MNAVPAEPGYFLNVQDYLAQEAKAEVRHEYIGGFVYAMAGASKRHNAIATELHVILSRHFGSGPCQAYVFDVKIALKVFERDGVYYPDVVVTCDPRDKDEYFVEFPKLIVEVLSDSTEAVDRREKLWSYTQIESVQEYILVAQDKSEVTIFRRSVGWKPEFYTALTEDLKLESIGLNLKLEQIYRRVTFS